MSEKNSVPVLEKVDLNRMGGDISQSILSIPVEVGGEEKKIVFFTSEDEKIDGASLYEGEEIDYSDFPECITIPFLKDGEKIDILYCIGEGELEKL